MSETTKVYWQGLEQLKNDPAFVKNAQHEFAAVEEKPEDPGHSRRDFLKMMGFGISAATLAACEAPVRYALPYVNKPVDVDPSVANYYASTYINGGDYCSVVVKTREGRPIKIDGNTLSKVTLGGTSAQVEASVLSLYDDFRLRRPRIDGKDASWEDVDSQVIGKLGEIAAAGGQIRIVSNTVLSPSTKAAIETFKAKYPTTQHIQYDPNSAYGIWKANAESFGTGFIPSYDFSKAKTIVSIAADFLGTWISPIEFTKQYADTRALNDGKKEMSRHYQFESNLSLTGANADYREPIRASQEGLIVAQLYNLIAAKAGKGSVGVGLENKTLNKAADDLWNTKGASLVVAGSNDKAVQILVNGINDMLGSYGATISTTNPVNFRQGNDEAMAAFIAEAGSAGAVIFFNCNPVYDHPQGAALASALKNVGLTVSTSSTPDETATDCKYIAPDNHYLESWNDAEPRKGSFSLSQPAIIPIFNTRQAQSSFLAWAGESNTDPFTFVKNNWVKWFGGNANAQMFWDKCLYDGVYEIGSGDSGSAVATFSGDVNSAATSISSTYKANNTGFELVLFEGYGIGTGAMANNPLLHELPDPITKVVWDHPLTMSLADAKGKFDLPNEESSESWTVLATLTVGKNSVTVPVLVQPGQAAGTIGLSVGYGRTSAGKVNEAVRGVNAYTLASLVNGSVNFSITSGVSLTNTNEKFQLAQTQTHNTYMGRKNVVQEATLPEYVKNPFAGRELPKITKWDDHVNPSSLSLWQGHEYKQHHWGMAIDMNACTGCGACVVACNVENNVALVGKQEVINRREMHWLRIDRYYSTVPGVEDLQGLEKAAENPDVVFQPMLCQHCNNAPCETVCPVAATTHSTEGVNQMTYNRCIGTRYCANNCPYKVRRFNWFKYHDNQQFAAVNPAMNTDLGRMVLNPDVTVRSRGVMEKCSFCVQRIQAGKLTAKKEKRSLKDGEVVVACATACSSGAILFGDMNDAESRISKLLQITADENGAAKSDKKVGNPRAFRVLEEIGVKPNIFYLTKIKNKESKTV